MVLVPCWIPRDFAADCLNTSTLPRKTSTLTYSVSTAILPYVSGVSLDEYYETVEKMGRNVTKIDKDAMLEYVRTSGGQVIANKGATFYAVSVAVCKLVATILSSSDSVATVSSMMHGEYGIEDVCLSTLTLVGPKGVQGKIPMRMTKEEVEKLKASADALKAVIAQIEH